MELTTLLAFAAVAGIAILSPGPAIVLAIRNATAFGVRSVLWSSLGNVLGVCCVSAACMLGLGALLASSNLLFGAVKVLGALYLFYLGARQLLGSAPALHMETDAASSKAAISRTQLSREAFLTAITNPKAILFFSALFPQFINAQAPLIGQYFIFTGIFAALSFTSLMGYALLAARARSLLARPRFARWVSRTFGALFIGFGAALLTLRRQTS
jgi:threonine/homoserine/homoserine lactone efflux protein